MSVRPVARVFYRLLAVALVLCGCTISESLGVYDELTSSEGAETVSTGSTAAGSTSSTNSTSADAGTGVSSGAATTVSASTGAGESTSPSTGEWGASEATTDAGLGRCAPEPGDDGCAQCLKQECCDALTGCEQVPDCLCLQTCLLNLSFPECSEWCPPGPAFTYLAACTATQCGLECQP